MEADQKATREGLERRTFLKHAATAAWASPIILTMMSRTAHAQQQCGTTTNGVTCTTTTPCGTTPPMVCAPDPSNGPGDPGPCICVPS